MSFSSGLGSIAAAAVCGAGAVAAAVTHAFALAGAALLACAAAMIVPKLVAVPYLSSQRQRYERSHRPLAGPRPGARLG